MCVHRDDAMLLYLIASLPLKTRASVNITIFESNY